MLFVPATPKNLPEGTGARDLRYRLQDLGRLSRRPGREAILAYVVFSNAAYQLAETGAYREMAAYRSGPMGAAAKIFYTVFGVTLAIGLAAPVGALITLAIRRVASRR